MDAEEPVSERAILRRAIDAVDKRLPPGWTLEVGYEVSGANGRKVDAALTVVAPDTTSARLILEAKRAVERRDVGTIVDRLKKLAGSNDTPVLVAKYLTPQVRSDLTANGVGYVDATGNLLITTKQPAIFISDRGEDRDPWRGTGRPRGTLRGEPAARVVRALLDLDRTWKVRELINTSGASTGATYRVLEYLQLEGLAERETGGAVRVPDWRRLLEAWAEDAPFLSVNRTAKCIEPRGTEAFLGKLRKTSGVRYAVTSSVAAVEWAPYAPARAVYVYVDSVEEAMNQWNLRPSESSPNVILLEPPSQTMSRSTGPLSRNEGLPLPRPHKLLSTCGTGPGATHQKPKNSLNGCLQTRVIGGND